MDSKAEGPMERSFPREIDALEDIFGFVSEFAERTGLAGPMVPRLKLAIEELFVNMVKHNPGSHEEVLISLARNRDRLIITLTDSDVEAFDITKADEYDVGESLDKRPIGHLGIHLVKRMVDEIDYQYKDRQSRITLIKDLGRGDVQD
jgi:anti-sigma regulatory factor (Ser/Thr protein kinase)